MMPASLNEWTPMKASVSARRVRSSWFALTTTPRITFGHEVLLDLTRVPRLTTQQLEQHRAAFEKWESPQDLLDKADGIMDYMGSEDCFNQPGLAFVREAWAASKFGLERNVETVRLVHGEFPDFEFRISTRIEQWEFTEADVGERRRGLEYRRGEYRGGN